MAELSATTVARAWAEYHAWTRGAADGQYEITEERAWKRLQDAVLRASVVPVSLKAPADAQTVDLHAAQSDNP